MPNNIEWVGEVGGSTGMVTTPIPDMENPWDSGSRDDNAWDSIWTYRTATKYQVTVSHRYVVDLSYSDFGAAFLYNTNLCEKQCQQISTIATCTNLGTRDLVMSLLWSEAPLLFIYTPGV